MPDPPRNRLTAAILTATVSAVTVSCARPVDGTAVYRPEEAQAPSALVRAADVQSLVLSAADLDALLSVSGLEKVDVSAVRSLPYGVLSEPSCGSVMQAGWLDTYRNSGHVGADGLLAQNSHEQQVGETVAVYRDGTIARAFVDTMLKQWKACIEKTVTQRAEGTTANFMAFGPSRSEGVDVLLVRREGGRGYACSRAIGAGANVTADVDVCGPDETVVNSQSAGVVNAILGRIHS